ncbi:MAG TPA: NUDIX domain-containing protein, partial [Allosphingosinicella sp.]|nr:NUDIX domain-containing protein [Allosphingosinicella sp.]
EARATLQGETVKARKWVLPKGHIEPGEARERTAVREVLEEAAVWARIRDDLGTFPFVGTAQPVRVRFFVMEYLGTARRRKPARHPWLRAPLPREDEPRRQDWKPVEKVEDLHKESQDAVNAALAYLRRAKD